MYIPVPNPTACNNDKASPAPKRDTLSAKEKEETSDDNDDGSNNSNAATPDMHKKAASHVCGASFIDMGFLSTAHCRMGHTITVAAPKNETNAGLVSTNATLCEMYPTDTNAPPIKTCILKLDLKFNKKGNSMIDARTILLDVAALAGKLSFMIAPSGKLVAYSMATRASTMRGPMYDERMPSMV
mmetsp:Transcript_18712/g.40709  ORF Transcript_18712/g.40709 Transcript_18712/m.40709 type:complete len:185 (-) Transcript_18712:203-757(-)